jgi:ankyrin repeat protein
MATLLLENGSRVGTATMEGAINLHNCGLIRLLIEKGADVNRRFRFAFEEVSPLYLAILWNYEDIVETLLAHGATVSANEVKLAKEKNRYPFLRRTMKRLGRRGPGSSWWPF